MTSSLQGQFIDYDATFEHTDGLGNKAVTIDSVDIHELIHLVTADGIFADGKFDTWSTMFPMSTTLRIPSGSAMAMSCRSRK